MSESDSEGTASSLKAEYDQRTRAEPCCHMSCLNGKQIPYSTFQRCRLLMSSIRSTGADHHRTFMCAMMAAPGNMHNRNARLTYRVFEYDGTVCYKAFSSCYGVSTRTLKRWRREIRSRKGFISAPHALSGRDGIRSNRAESMLTRSRAIAFIASTTDRIGESRPARPGDMIFLPPYVSKRLIYRSYKETSTEQQHNAASFSTFCLWWSQDLGNIQIYPTEKGMCTICVAF